jgi:chromosome segregation ATPase
LHGRAAVLYERAVQTFSGELSKVDASIRSIRNGAFLEALVREEIRQDKDWVIRLRELPGAPETFYLVSLMASDEFQTALQNYLDLEDLRRKLTAWRRSLASFEDITQKRRAYYEPLLPEIDKRFRRLDAQMRLRLEQRKHLQRRLNRILTSPRPELLVTSSEQAAGAQLDRIEAELATKNGSDQVELHGRLKRLRGVLAWRLEIEYADRLTDAHTHLRELNTDIDKLTAQYDSFVRTRQAAVHSFSGYQDRIEDLRARVGRALEQIDSLMARQGRLLESVAIRELASRRDRLEAYQNKARFAFADSYDRAVKSQVKVQ